MPFECHCSVRGPEYAGYLAKSTLRPSTLTFRRSPICAEAHRGYSAQTRIRE